MFQARVMFQKKERSETPVVAFAGNNTPVCEWGMLHCATHFAFTCGGGIFGVRAIPTLLRRLEMCERDGY